MSESQEQLFQIANQKLENSFYRHTKNFKTNEQNLSNFSEGLHKFIPELPEQQTVLLTVKEVKNTSANNKVSYTYQVVLPGSSDVYPTYNTIREAYDYANKCNLFST